MCTCCVRVHPTLYRVWLAIEIKRERCIEQQHVQSLLVWCCAIKAIKTGTTFVNRFIHVTPPSALSSNTVWNYFFSGRQWNIPVKTVLLFNMFSLPTPRLGQPQASNCDTLPTPNQIWCEGLRGQIKYDASEWQSTSPTILNQFSSKIGPFKLSNGCRLNRFELNFLALYISALDHRAGCWISGIRVKNS